MRVNLTSALLRAASAHTLDLLGVLYLADRMGHRVMTPYEDANAWCDTLSEPLNDTIHTLLDQHRTDAIDVSRQITIHEHTQSDWPNAHLSLDDAFLLLKSPLELLLENERSDWAFLSRLATKEQREALEDALRRGALSLRQGGGITEINKSLQALQGNEPHLRLRRLRTWTLFDRDAAPTDKAAPSTHSDTLKATCEALQNTPGDPAGWHLSWRRLQRRNIENYLPLAALQDHFETPSPGLQARLDALEALRHTTPHIAHCIDLKNGLLKDLKKKKNNLYDKARSDDPTSRQEAHDEIPTQDWPPPFDQLPTQHRTNLLAGFGDNIWRAFLNTTVPQTSFTQEFDNSDGSLGSAYQLIDSILKEM